MVVFLPAPLPESQVASKLIESIRAKEDLQALSVVIDSLPSVNPELSLDRNSNIKSCQVFLIYSFSVVSEFLCAKVSLVTQCVLYVGFKTISHSFLALMK